MAALYFGFCSFCALVVIAIVFIDGWVKPLLDREIWRTNLKLYILSMWASFVLACALEVTG